MNKQSELPGNPVSAVVVRYIDPMSDLFDEARKRGEVEAFTQALAGMIAGVIHLEASQKVTGDFLTALGCFLVGFDEARQARRELEALRENGAEVN